MAAETTEKQQRGRPFRPGTSGNPRGRAVGARNKATLAAEALMDSEANKLTRKAIELALSGDTVALKLCIDRILPPRRHRPVTFDMPPLAKASDAQLALAKITCALSLGELTAMEAVELARLVEIYVQTVEATEFEHRIRALEEQQACERGALVIGLVDNLLRPILVGKDTKMPDYLVLISTVGGIATFGLNGFIIGPVIAAMFIAAWDILSVSRQSVENDDTIR